MKRQFSLNLILNNYVSTSDLFKHLIPTFEQQLTQTNDEKFF